MTDKACDYCGVSENETKESKIVKTSLRSKKGNRGMGAQKKTD